MGIRSIAVIAFAALSFSNLIAEEPILFRISVENVSSHFQAKLARRFSEALAAKAGEGLKVEFYDGARLFRDADVIAALARGSVEMAMPGVWQLDKLVPDTAILMLPSVYGSSGSTMRAAIDGPLGSFLVERVEKALPVKVIGPWLDLGHAHLFSSGSGIRSAADIAGKRIRVAGGRANEERIRALGGKLLSIPSPDLATYLDRGLVDGILSTYETVATAGFDAHGLTTVFEDREYYPFYLPLVSKATWESLPESTRASISELWGEMLAEGRADSALAQSAAKAALDKAGMTIVLPSAAETAGVASRLRAEERAMARRLGVSEEALAILRATFPGGPR